MEEISVFAILLQICLPALVTGKVIDTSYQPCHPASGISIKVLWMRCIKTVGKVRPRRVQRVGGELGRCTSSLLSRMCHGVCRWSRPACRATSRPFVTVVVGFQRLFFSGS